MTWQTSLGLTAVVVTAFVAVKALEALERLNKQMENVRFYLGELTSRQQRMSDKLHAIEAHTHRSVEAQYEQDDRDMRQPPI